MDKLKKLILIKIVLFVISIGILFILIISIISAVTGVAIGYETAYKQASETTTTIVLNNQLYASRYKQILNKYLVEKGYVTLERLVFYLQRTNNVLDITTLSDEIWENAYLNNLDIDEKQMIPIKTICKNIKYDQSLPTFNVENGFNTSGDLIEVIDLCNVNGKDITTSNEYLDIYPLLPYIFPLKSNFTVTSIVFENRTVDLETEENLENINHHTGWDFAVPIGTNFYSVCTGIIKNIVYTQDNDLPYNTSKNEIGNYVEVQCEDGIVVSYNHIKSQSVPTKYLKGSMIRQGELLGKTSTTGLSEGPHLHIEAKTKDNELVDILQYINLSNEK